MKLIDSGGFSLKNVERYGTISHFSGLLWPDLGNTALVDTAGLGSTGLDYYIIDKLVSIFITAYTL